MTKRRKAGLTACSDPRSPERQEEVSRLCEVLEAEGLEIVENPDLFLDDVLDERIKAKALNRLFRNPEIEMIFDISGGDQYFLIWIMRRSKKAGRCFSDSATLPRY